MNRSSFYLKRLSQGMRWSAIASVFFLTGYASSLSNEHHIWQGRAIDRHPAGSSEAPKSAKLSSRSRILAEGARPILVSAPDINSESLAARFVGPLPGSNHSLPVSASGPAFSVSYPVSLPLEPKDDEGAKHRLAAYSPSSVFSLAELPSETVPEANTGTPQISHTMAPRNDLLDGVLIATEN